MRLLNVDTLELRTFYNASKRPAYAILSHTWGDEEVSFEDIKKFDNVRRHPGFSKVESCCRIASSRRIEWIWIDTCCIDKSSSAELSEAINSMYKWYSEATECYAHLADVKYKCKPSRERPFDDHSFARSRWFTRGWTLQELIAPSSLWFYSSDWKFLSSRSTLFIELSRITSVPEYVFNAKGRRARTNVVQPQYSIAQKMSWASSRETEREEDMAYCLMGLFDVNMPLLYGEGSERAFLQLQEEILKRSEDHSIFLWQPPSPYFADHGLLADSPRAFKNSHSYAPTGVYRHTHEMTNLGLCITLPLMYWNHKDSTQGYVGILGAYSTEDAAVQGADESIRAGIALVQDLRQQGDNRRLLRTSNQPLLRVHFKVDYKTKRPIARVLEGRGVRSSRPFQFTNIMAIYVGQISGSVASFRSKRTGEMLFQPEVCFDCQ
jgi:hypothetical protein